MRRLSVVLLVWLGCRPPQPASLATGLVGVWHSPGTADCRNAAMEFRVDGTMVVNSGKQAVTGTYAVDSGPSRLIVRHTDLRTNGEPNCQGIPAEYVLSHYLDTAYIDVHGDTLRIFTAPEGLDPFLTAVRVR